MDIEQSAVPQDVTPAPEASAEITKPTDLEGISEFTFGGEKYTPDGLHEILKNYKGYQDQLKEYTEEQKFRENLEVDLDNVLANPNLADRFKQIYPKRFHGILDRMIKSQSTQGTPSSTPTAPAQAALPKELFGLMDDVAAMKQHILDTQVEAASAKLDAILPKLWTKYPFANEDQVLARAEARQKGQKEPIAEVVWERIARESHEAAKKKYDQHNQQELKRQMEKGKQGKDTGPGGSTPGQAPRKARNFDQAYDEMVKSLAR